jgi:hypothetical protein
MKNVSRIFLVGLPLVFCVVGCGPSKEELAARERARLELERQAQADAAKANKAITEMNKKMFSKMNASRTGAPNRPPEPPAPTKSESPKR